MEPAGEGRAAIAVEHSIATHQGRGDAKKFPSASFLDLRGIVSLEIESWSGAHFDG
jgi:hypothetical protein